METNKEILRPPQGKMKHYKKGEIIQSRGESSPKIFYVQKGLIRSFLNDEKGKEHIFTFACEGWMIADLESLEFHHPTLLTIDCLEDCEVIIMDREAQIKNLNNEEAVKDKLKHLYRRIGVLQRRIIMQMSSPAGERYQYFLETYPDLPNRIPQYMIASYLGITPQALSTIRKEIGSFKEIN